MRTRPACQGMMSESSAAFAASPRVAGAIGVVLWVVLSACSGAPTDPGGLGYDQKSVDDAGAAATQPADEGGSDSAPPKEMPSGPAYQGKSMDDTESDASASVASADGNCPLNDILDDQGPSCSSCAASHCSSALAMCDPTMVNGCTEYYCPTQCPQLGDGGGASVNACAKVVQCCPTLLGTPFGLTCLTYQATSAQADCEGLLMQAQAIGRCM
jgi:hypothetical protein